MANEHEGKARRYPYEPLGEFYDQATELLGLSMKDGEVHIPTLAQRVLDELILIGPTHVKDAAPPENIRRVKVGEKQEVWIRFDTYRGDEGYMAVEAVDAPESDAAILAAMTAFLIEPIDHERLTEALQFWFSEARVDREKEAERLRKKIEEGQAATYDDFDLLFKIQLELIDKAKRVSPLLHYVLPLLEYHRPELREYPLQERYKYALKAVDHVNDFLRSLRNLQGFLEYGAPDRKLTPAIKQPQRDVRAAVLRDVDGLSYREIGERLDVPPPPDFAIKKEHQTVRKMVENGKLMLKEAFGEEGWRDRAKAMKAEKAWWQSLSSAEQQKEREAESIALDLGIPIEEARQQVERKDS